MKTYNSPHLFFSCLITLLLWLGTIFPSLAQEFSPELVKKAEAGDAESQYQLSRCYKLGESVPEDQAESAKWELKAADQGHLEAQFMHGARLITGLGKDGKREPLLAAKWLNLAVKGGHPKAPGVLNYVQTEMTPEQIEEAKKLAAEWKPSTKTTEGAARSGDMNKDGKMKTWISSDGRSITAEWVRLEGDSVILKRADGQVFQVPLNKLSAESQSAAKQQAGN